MQVSSQRSEADAESAYRGIQAKYPSVLGSQPHTVRRADLGAKGVYYRAMVGPFATPRRGGPALQQPEAGRRRLRCAALR